MPKKLSQHQIDRYHRDGFLFPIDVMSQSEALGYAGHLAEAERKYPQGIHATNRNNAHLTFAFLDELVHHQEILDAVEDLIGGNILAWATVLFTKEAHDPGFVTWHQDYTYMGLDPHEGVSAWLALSPSTVESGCMRMLPGTHMGGIRPHRDTFAEDNILTRGQTIDEVDESSAVDLVLKPGQMSLHHPRIIHGSQPNRSDYRRVGFTIQSYLPPHVRSIKEQGFATVVRGTDTHGHHEILPRPKTDMTPESVAIRTRVDAIRAAVLYDGAAQKRAY